MEFFPSNETPKAACKMIIWSDVARKEKTKRDINSQLELEVEAFKLHIDLCSNSPMGQKAVAERMTLI